ncbi:MAG: hypothetical protein AAF692_09165, partial [Pseudomonadota bacterium]
TIKAADNKNGAPGKKNGALSRVKLAKICAMMSGDVAMEERHLNISRDDIATISVYDICQAGRTCMKGRRVAGSLAPFALDPWRTPRFIASQIKTVLCERENP